MPNLRRAIVIALVPMALAGIALAAPGVSDATPTTVAPSTATYNQVLTNTVYYDATPTKVKVQAPKVDDVIRAVSQLETGIKARLHAMAAARAVNTGPITDGPGVMVYGGPIARAHGINSLHLGAYVNRANWAGALRKLLMYCEDYVKYLYSSHPVSVTGKPNTLRPWTIQQMIWVVNEYGNLTGSKAPNLTAAAVASSVSSLASAKFRSDWNKSYQHQLGGKHGKVPTIMRSMLANAAKLAGNYAIKAGPLSTTTAGRVASQTFTVTSAHSHAPEPGLKVSVNWVKGTDLTGSRPRQTNGKGQFTVHYIVVPGAFNAKFTVEGASSAKVLITHPSPSEQHLLGRYGNQSASVTSSAAGRFPKLKLKVVCDAKVCTTGKHVPVEVQKVCAGSLKLRESAVDLTTGKGIGTYVIKPGKCLAPTVYANDHDKVQVSLAVLVGSVWHSQVVASTLVLCPEILNVPVNVFCDCNGHGYLDILPFKNTTLNTTRVLVNDKVIVTVAPGATSKDTHVPATKSGWAYKVVVEAEYGSTGKWKPRTEYDGHIY